MPRVLAFSRTFLLFVCSVSAAVLLPGPAQAVAEPASCADFMTAMTQTLADQHAQFEHTLVVSLTARVTGAEVYDLATQSQVGGTLNCRNDRLVRFEAKITVPADAQLLHNFDLVQASALASALQWKPGRVAKALRAMNGEAGEYLRASIERGDVYLAGKTEYHENGSDLGMIWTNTDRTFIIAGSE